MGDCVRVASFPPQVTRRCRVLVLGSMPGVRSLQLHQYYGHPQNLFWPFMHALTGVDPLMSYAKRVAALNRAGVGLWDVLQQCERPGSLDSAIARHSEIPNAIPELLAATPGICAIALNGAKAAQAFRRHVADALPSAIAARVTILELPSTSPANASIPRDDKLARWSVITGHLTP